MLCCICNVTVVERGGERYNIEKPDNEDTKLPLLNLFEETLHIRNHKIAFQSLFIDTLYLEVKKTSTA